MLPRLFIRIPNSPIEKSAFILRRIRRLICLTCLLVLIWVMVSMNWGTDQSQTQTSTAFQLMRYTPLGSKPSQWIGGGATMTPIGDVGDTRHIPQHSEYCLFLPRSTSSSRDPERLVSPRTRGYLRPSRNGAAGDSQHQFLSQRNNASQAQSPGMGIVSDM